MSSPLSFGDIVLATKLTFTLYKAIANSITATPTELKELSDALYSLRCALSHLGNLAKTLAKAASTSILTSSETDDGLDPIESLNHMVKSCLSTLKELDVTTKKYREAANAVEPEPASLSEVKTTPNSIKAKQQKTPGIAQKIRWDLEKDSLEGYRRKLDSHTNTITMFLVTFQTQITLLINEDNKQWQDKILSLHMDKHLVQETTASGPKIKTSDSIPPTHPQGGQSGTPLSPAAALVMANSMSTTNITPKSVFNPSNVPGRKGHAHPVSPTACPMVDGPVQDQLSSSTNIELNIRRQAMGSEQFVKFQNQYNVINSSKPERSKTPPSQPPMACASHCSQPKPASRRQASPPLSNPKLSPAPAPIPPFKFLQTENLTIPHLQGGLEYIFRPFQEATRRQARSDHAGRMKEISQWMREVDFFIASSRAVGDGDGKKGLDLSLENGMIDLLFQMNDSLETCKDGMRRLFYQSVKDVEFEKTVDKLLGVFGSVRGRAAVEEFLDVMEEWEG